MGWWKTGHNDDIIGDDAADAIIGTLEFHAEMNGQKPTFQELLDAMANLVRFDGELFLSDPESLGDKELQAVFAPPAPALQSRPTSTSPLIFDLTRVFERIAEQYLATDYSRKPRLSELLAAVAFVLRSRPERLLREAEGLRLIELRIRPD